ncbi:MAG: hypothetical protein JNM18_14410, partial [Planctomycetaceae bacterium]|nr:hypothetical protein [Planctomycetaceae bacterium]
ERLCELSRQAHVEVSWDEGMFLPHSVAELQEACVEVDGVMVLRLCDEQARWGEFDDIETFLMQESLPFRRYSEGDYSCSPELVYSYPGLGRKSIVTNLDRQPVIIAADVEQVLGKLAQATTPGSTIRRATLFSVVRQAGRQLRELLPETIPPLAPFTVSSVQALPASTESGRHHRRAK